MADYIDKQKTLNVIFEIAENVINSLPSSDVVEIVRCKDCKWWRDTDHTCKEHSLVSPMGAEEFCSRGERKDG